MTFKHPGKLYIQKIKQINSVEDILAYSDFLRIEAGIDEIIPVDLIAIFTRFGIPEPKAFPIPDLQGLLVDPEAGLIIINSNDPELRQKFTKAHELVEMLFSQLPKTNNLIGKPNRQAGFRLNTKESLCNWTAANLLMPPKLVKSHIDRCGISFESARKVARDFQVSLSAALIQLARLSSKNHAVVLWRLKNKPSELKNKIPDSQLSFEGLEQFEQIPPKKLRVEWVLGNGESLYIPKNKSTDEDTLIYSAYQNSNFTSGKERHCFDNRLYSWYHVENLAFNINDEQIVLSLIEKL